jgi:hypothetical protein
VINLRIMPAQQLMTNIEGKLGRREVIIADELHDCVQDTLRYLDDDKLLAPQPRSSGQAIANPTATAAWPEGHLRSCRWWIARHGLTLQNSVSDAHTLLPECSPPETLNTYTPWASALPKFANARRRHTSNENRHLQHQ